jgi:hypothetical protein
MKNQITSVRHDAADLQAKKAIHQIQKWIEKKNPRLAAAAKTRLIIECLIELTEERKFLAAS